MPMTYMTAMPSSKFNNEKKITVLLLVLVLIGFLIRLLPIVRGQIFFWFDQGLDILLVKHLVVDHVFSLTGRYSSSQGVLMGPFWTWLLAIPFILSGGSPLANSVFFSILSLISSIATFKILTKLTTRTIGIIAAALTIFAPVYIFSSLVVSSPNPLTFLFIFYLWFLYEIVVNKKALFWIPLGLLVGIFFQLEVAVGVFTLPAVLLTLVAFKQYKTLWSRHFLAGAIIFSLTFLPQAIFDLRHNFLISKGFLDVIFGTSQSLHLGSDPLPVRLIERAKSFAQDFSRMALFVQPQILVWVTLLLAAVGWFQIHRQNLKNEKNVFKLLIITLLSFYICFSLYKGPLWEWYRAGLPIVYILLIAIPLGFLVTKNKIFAGAIILLLLIFIITGINPPSFLARLQNKTINDNAILQNQLSAIDYVYQSAGGKPFAYFAYTPPVYDYIWQYDFWWYGRSRYGYVPKNLGTNIPLLGIGTQSQPPKENEGLFFAIAEPNKERPWEVDGWFKSYIKVGKIISAKKFPGDIIVQERLTND